MTFYSPISAEVAAAMEMDNITVAIAIKLNTADGDVCTHTGTGPIIIDGVTYHGVGELGEVGTATEEHSTSASKITLSLSGLDQSLMSEVLNTNLVGRSVEEYLVVISEGASLAANLLFKGRVSQSSVSAGNTNAIKLTVSNVFEDWSRAPNKRFTEQSHLRDYPNDHVFRYVAQMASRTLYWGNKTDAPSFTYS